MTLQKTIEEERDKFLTNNVYDNIFIEQFEEVEMEFNALVISIIKAVRDEVLTVETDAKNEDGAVGYIQCLLQAKAKFQEIIKSLEQ